MAVLKNIKLRRLVIGSEMSNVIDILAKAPIRLGVMAERVDTSVAHIDNLAKAAQDAAKVDHDITGISDGSEQNGQAVSEMASGPNQSNALRERAAVFPRDLRAA
ncbi:MAG: hypothetical protein K9H25_07725 [Rhodospirillum sp.]|nr:hypothetical protein [Rhodospirillum sp.]MCF8491212.1 hypothetical protein [Rhodospirillum sp.]